jgi:hypothetical protein
MELWRHWANRSSVIKKKPVEDLTKLGAVLFFFKITNNDFLINADNCIICLSWCHQLQ